MTRRINPALLAALYLALTLPALAAGKVPMWKAVLGSSEVYLLGSIHVADQSFYPLDPALETAFGQSSRLVVEVDASGVNQESLMGLLTVKGLYAEGDSIQKHLSAGVMADLAAYMDKLGFPMEFIERMKPWAAYMMVEQMEMQQMGLDPELGVDMHFIEKARKTGKPISELESAEAQLDLLAGFDDATQEGLMAMALKEGDKLRESVTAVMAAWKSGDARKMEALTFESLKTNPELSPVYEKMFFQRNIAMAEKIARMASPSQSLFVVVGAGHLLGEKGVVRLLEKKGFIAAQSNSAR